MGRGKVQLKLIEDKNSRQVTFSKRKNGVVKKARELSVLCDVEVGAVIFSGKGKLYEFSTGDSMKKIYERHHIKEDEQFAATNVDEPEVQGENAALFQGDNILQILQRNLQENELDKLNFTQFIQLETQLNSMLTQTRLRKTQLMLEAVEALQQQEKQLAEANMQLRNQLTASEGNLNNNNQKKQAFDVNIEPNGDTTTHPQPLIGFF